MALTEEMVDEPLLCVFSGNDELTPTDMAALPIPGTDALCDVGADGKYGVIWQDSEDCEHSYSASINYLETTCAVNRFGCPRFAIWAFAGQQTT